MDLLDVGCGILNNKLERYLTTYSPIRHIFSSVLNTEIKPLSVSICVHVRAKIKFIIGLGDFDDSC